MDMKVHCTCQVTVCVICTGIVCLDFRACLSKKTLFIAEEKLFHVTRKNSLSNICDLINLIKNSFTVNVQYICWGGVYSNIHSCTHHFSPAPYKPVKWDFNVNIGHRHRLTDWTEKFYKSKHKLYFIIFGICMRFQ